MTRQIEEIIKEREKKLKKIESFFEKAFPLGSKKTHSVAEFLQNFKKLEKTKEEVFLVGRIIAQRIHGKISFLDLYEEGEKIQLVVAEDKVGENSYQNFLDLVDIGDIIQVRGIAFTTKRGEKSLEVLDWKILAKSLRPLPEKWHGLRDVEERYRKRYLDLIFNKEVREKFILRSKIISEIRKFLEREGFLEVETPILQTAYGGARAKPFKTHLNALDLDLYLRIAPELYLKRLLIGGFEKIFEIGKCFRNEGMDKFHNPDFTVLEFYWAFADYKMLMKLTERMFKYLLRKLFKKQKIVYQGREINFKTPFERIEFDVLFRKETEIDYGTVNRDALFKKAKELGLEIDEKAPKFEIADEIFKKIIRPKIWNPTFIIHYPLGFQVLAKALENRPERLANFQLIVAGIELVNAFSELNDPIEQRRRFEEQQKLKKEGFEEAHPFDEDFLEALEYGMPPSAGFGMGIDRLVMLLTDSYSLREAILFPTMKPK
jgi:lysyl-tRNA synthetase class 2